MVNVETVTTVYAKIDNRPGSLERVARVFHDRRTNIDAIAAETVGSTGFVRILAQRPREVVDALKHVDIDCYESQAVVASLPNKPGELFRATADLAAAGLNVEAVFTTPEGKLAIRTNDNERAAQILRKL